MACNNWVAKVWEEDKLPKIAITIEDERDISQNTFTKNILKMHRMVQADETGKQRRIVKLTSDSFKEAV